MQTKPNDENVTDGRTFDYDGNADDDGRPAVFAQLRTGQSTSSTVFGDGAKAEIVVDDGELELTLTVDEFDDPGRLLDHDILSVVLAAKDIGDGDR